MTLQLKASRRRHCLWSLSAIAGDEPCGDGQVEEDPGDAVGEGGGVGAGQVKYFARQPAAQGKDAEVNCTVTVFCHRIFLMLTALSPYPKGSCQASRETRQGQMIRTYCCGKILFFKVGLSSI